MAKSNMKKNILQFLDYLETKKKRGGPTVKNYDFYLSRFGKWAKENGISDPKKITIATVEHYKNWLNKFKNKKKSGLKKNTQNYHLIALRSFLKYLKRTNLKILDSTKIRLDKMPVPEVVFMDSKELERLLNAPLLNTPPPANTVARRQRLCRRSAGRPNPLLRKEGGIIPLRDKAILETLFSTGLRVSELSNLRIKQISLNKQNNSDELTIKGNNNKSRTVFLSNHAKYWIKKYLNARNDKSKYLFASHDKAKNKRDRRGVLQYAPTKYTPLTSRSIQRIVKKYATLAGITKKISPRALRRSFAANLLRNGRDIKTAQTMLGHSSIATTEHYIKN